MAETFDYVIVGAGSAGCVLTNRLSADPSIRVLLLEAGSKDNHRWMSVPLALARLHGDPRIDWSFRSEPEPHLGGRVIVMPRGKTLGGSSSINGMLYVRGPAADYDHWRQLGNRGWGWDDVLPYFKKSEDCYLGPSESRGAGGELKVSIARDNWEIAEAFRDAAVQCGIPYVADPACGSNEASISRTEFTISNGVRWSTSQAFLRPALHRPNLKVVSDALVERIIVEGKRAKRVRFVRDGANHEVEANVEVLLSAGAFGSPQLLQLSGIGPGALLREHGIEVRHELPGVGENLHDHWYVRMTHRVHNTVTLSGKVGTRIGRMIQGARYFTMRRGPLAAPPMMLLAHAKSDPAVAAHDIELIVSVASFSRIGAPMDPYPGISASITVNRPTSRGYVRIKSCDPNVYPAILNNFMATENDRRIGLAGMKLVRRIVETPAMAPFDPEETLPTIEKASSDEELMAFARETASTAFHPVGTCMMGQGRMAVVDDRLRVHGIDGLRVVDASIMPAIPAANTNAPTIMIAEKAADMVREDRRTMTAAISLQKSA